MRTIIVILIWLSAAPVFADIINGVSPGAGGLSAWASDSKFGQSFTATINEPQVGTVSLYWGGSLGQEQLAAPTITAQLRNGNGLDGNILGTTAAVGPIPYTLADSWIDFRFPNPIALVTGQVYTLRFDVLPTGSVAGVIGMSFANPYPGGQSFLLFPRTNGDLDFRVLSSPEPSSLFLLAIGAVSLLGRRRR